MKSNESKSSNAKSSSKNVKKATAPSSGSRGTRAKHTIIDVREDSTSHTQHSTSSRKDSEKRAKRRKQATLVLCIIWFILSYFCWFSLDDDEELITVDEALASQTDLLAHIVGTDEYNMVIHAIDVEQGDCTLVQGGGVNILIDAGENDQGSAAVNYLRDLGIEQLDWLICTHPHSDHIGGADTVLEQIGADKVMLPVIPDDSVPTTNTYLDLLDAIDQCGASLVEARMRDVYTFGNMTMTVLAPITDKVYSDLNDYSICLRFECGDVSFLTCGDATSKVETQLVSMAPELKSTIFKASHHGSQYSNSESFVEAVSPEYIFISVGEYNDYGHPAPRVVRLFESLEANIARTDKSGNIIYTCNGNRVTVEKQYINGKKIKERFSCS